MPPWKPTAFSFDAQRNMLRKPATEIVRLAKNGSLLAVYVLVNKHDTIPNSWHTDILRTYCFLLQHSEPPCPRLLASEGSRESEAVQRAGYCLLGLARVLDDLDILLGEDTTPLEPVAIAWNEMFKWMVFLYELCRAEDPQHLMLMVIMNIVHKACVRQEMKRQVSETPGIVALTVSIWMNEQLAPEVPSSMVTLNLVELLGSLPLSAVGEVIASVGGKASDLADRLVRCLRLAVKKRALSAEHLLLYLKLVHHLGAPLSPERAAFLDPGVLRAVTKTLVRMSALKIGHDSQVRSALDLGFALVFSFIETGTAIERVRQCIHDGILEAIVNSAPHLDDLPSEPIEWVLIVDIIPRYIVFRSVLEAVCKSLATLQDAEHRDKIARSSRSSVKEAWDGLCVLVDSQQKLKSVVESELSAMDAECDTCNQLGPKHQFRQCAGCHSAVYCSMQCQKSAWATTHKTSCGLRKRPTSGLSRRDAHYLHALAIHHAKQIAPRLLAQAAAELVPDGPLHSFFFALDYTDGSQATCSMVDIFPGDIGESRAEKSERYRTFTVLWVSVRLGEYREITSLRVPSLLQTEQEPEDGQPIRDIIRVEDVIREPIEK
ncbi:hypothetical protein FA95DRAFT_1565164 [Auriscalpium vulgare]|uniref:Uncharacterized protein n=1 Tax=Auriscalpium vulgare TaxID=40419 RepID=A0ACB8RCS0_9AGAM|nr:hypothetical protein FA95DRAFT_1565164 [Auriscalpium vulgare]